VSYIGLVEIFRQTQILQAAKFNFTPYVATALVFLVVTIPLARFTDWLIARQRRRGLGGAGAGGGQRNGVMFGGGRSREIRGPR
jgi:polar amino acid transport system permease protein